MRWWCVRGEPRGRVKGWGGGCAGRGGCRRARRVTSRHVTWRGSGLARAWRRRGEGERERERQSARERARQAGRRGAVT